MSGRLTDTTKQKSPKQKKKTINSVSNAGSVHGKEYSLELYSRETLRYTARAKRNQFWRFYLFIIVFYLLGGSHMVRTKNLRGRAVNVIYPTWTSVPFVPW
jgi:hypothetical protein